METHEFEIEIKPGGEVRVHVKGVKGPGCLEYARMLEEILEQEGTQELTSEYYEQPTGVDVHIHEKTE